MTKLQIPATPAIINSGGDRKMARDKAKQYAANMASRQRIYHERSLRFRKDSGIVEALEAMTAFTGVSASKYIMDAITESLQRDGYLKSEKTVEESTDQ